MISNAWGNDNVALVEYGGDAVDVDSSSSLCLVSSQVSVKGHVP